VDGTDYGLSTLRSFFCQYQKLIGKERIGIMRHAIIIWTSPTHPMSRSWGLTGLDTIFLPSDGVRPAPPPALFGAAFLCHVPRCHDGSSSSHPLHHPDHSPIRAAVCQHRATRRYRAARFCPHQPHVPTVEDDNNSGGRSTGRSGVGDVLTCCSTAMWFHGISAMSLLSFDRFHLSSAMVVIVVVEEEEEEGSSSYFAIRLRRLIRQCEILATTMEGLTSDI